MNEPPSKMGLICDGLIHETNLPSSQKLKMYKFEELSKELKISL